MECDDCEGTGVLTVERGWVNEPCKGVGGPGDCHPGESPEPCERCHGTGRIGRLQSLIEKLQSSPNVATAHRFLAALYAAGLALDERVLDELASRNLDALVVFASCEANARVGYKVRECRRLVANAYRSAVASLLDESAPPLRSLLRELDAQWGQASLSADAADNEYRRALTALEGAQMDLAAHMAHGRCAEMSVYDVFCEG